MLFIALFQKPIFNMKHVTSKTWYWISKICKHLAGFLLFGTRKILLLLTGIFRLLITCLALVLRNFLTFNSSSYFFFFYEFLQDIFLLLILLNISHATPSQMRFSCTSFLPCILRHQTKELLSKFIQVTPLSDTLKLEHVCHLTSELSPPHALAIVHLGVVISHSKAPLRAVSFYNRYHLCPLATPALVSVDGILVSVDSIGVLKQDLTRRCWCLRRWRGRCLVQHPKRVSAGPEAEIL